MDSEGEELTRASLTHDAGHPKPELCDACRDRVGRELGGESRMKGTCVPVTVSCRYMAKIITIL